MAVRALESICRERDARDGGSHARVVHSRLGDRPRRNLTSFRLSNCWICARARDPLECCHPRTHRECPGRSSSALRADCSRDQRSLAGCDLRAQFSVLSRVLLLTSLFAAEYGTAVAAKLLPDSNFATQNMGPPRIELGSYGPHPQRIPLPHGPVSWWMPVCCLSVSFRLDSRQETVPIATLERHLSQTSTRSSDTTTPRSASALPTNSPKHTAALFGV